MKTSRIFLSFLLVSLVLLSTSCDKENLEHKPELPPVESMLMDFSAFETNPFGDTKGVVVSHDNFVHAYTNVAFWNAFTTITLAVPVGAYGHALQQTAEYVGNDTWEWSYDFTILQTTYTATLTGKRLTNETFSMEMEISNSSLPGVKFTYFDGVCRYDRTHAEWNLYEIAQGTSTRILEVEWDKDYETGDATMKYTYVKADQDETGSYIFYEYDADATPYNSSYIIDLAAGVINIEWDKAIKAGRIKDPIYFEDTEWHYWDADFHNFIPSN